MSAGNAATPFTITKVKTADRDTMIDVVDANGTSIWRAYDSPENQKIAAFIVRACNRDHLFDEMVKAAAKHLEWIDKERQGPVYPEGVSRDSEDGEAIWRKWWDEQMSLCAETEALCRAALAKVPTC